ncbi:MAG: hypothetical protein R2839_08450 [Thermomicrobiales bacterium]
MRLGYRLHGDQMVFESSNTSGVIVLAAPGVAASASRPPLDAPVRGRKPVDLYPQLRQRLFENPALAVVPLDEHRAIRYSATQDSDDRCLRRADPTRRRQVGDQLVGLFDIECHSGFLGRLA